MARTLQTTFSYTYFHERKFLYSGCKLSSCSNGHWVGIGIGSSNGLAPNRRQAIALTDDDTIYLRTYASPDVDELKLISGLRCVQVSSEVTIIMQPEQ